MLSLTEQNSILNLIVINHPNVPACIEGHIGESIVSTEQDIEEDKIVEVRVSRCSECGLPDGKEEQL